VVAGFGINADEIPNMAESVRGAARKFNLKLEHPAELKFYHVGKNNHDKARHRKNWMLDAGLADAKQRRALVRVCLRGGLAMSSLRVIAVAVDQRKLPEDESAIVTAVSMVLDRVQMDSQDFGTHSLVMMDEEHTEDKDLREAMRSGSSLIRNYNRMLDTIAFLPSEESPGIQLADLVAGSVSRYLNTGDPGFMRLIWPRMRHRNGERNGYGMIAHPRGQKAAEPSPQRVPWPDFDRHVHEYECGARGVPVLWDENGVPDKDFAPSEPVNGI
jgi:hypothetical protein